MRRRDILHQALLPSQDERWPHGDRLRWIYLAKLWMVSAALVGNGCLWLVLHGDPATRPIGLDITVGAMSAALALDIALTIGFLRGPRCPRWAVLVGAGLEAAFAVIWIQSTGTVTSYFVGSILIFAMLYRLIGNYWCGLACLATGASGIFAAYALEELGVLPRSSMFMHDAGGALLPEAYRQAAFLSITSFMTIGFVGMNLLARSFERGRAELERTRAELAKVVDEAQLGRLSGTRLGCYQLRELLGRGGMGEVYEARDATGAPVACKVLHAHLGADHTARERFRREAELVRRLPGHCAARVLEVGTGRDGAEFIAMERLRGEDVGTLLRRRGRLTLDETVVLTRAMADALGEAHAAGIVHRDLKPSNVFLVDERVDLVRLLDFGIARLYEAPSTTTLTETSAVIGSPGYMPPEQAIGDHAAIGPATDVFALGAIVYRALTGEAAFPSRNPAAAIFEAVHHLPPAPSGLAPLPPGIDRVLGVALAKDPQRRYSVPRVFADDLARAAAGDPMDELAARATGVSAATVSTLTDEEGVPATMRADGSGGVTSVTRLAPRR